MDNRRYLLCQMRASGDPMRGQEIACFSSAIGCSPARVSAYDLIAGGPTRAQLDRHDMVLIGGSGDYSAAGEADWHDAAFDALRELHALRKPTFGSCWGFQALARALGGDCVHDPEHAELGPVELSLTSAGQSDPVFGALPSTFIGHGGHEDRVTRLPPGAVLLCSSPRVAEQALRFDGAPIYATQFHPELTVKAFLERVEAYPKYVELIAGVSLAEFRQQCVETPEANTLIRRVADVLLP